MSIHTIQRAVPRMPFDSLAIVRGCDGQVMRVRDVSEHGVFVYSKATPAFFMDIGRVLDVDVLGTNQGLRCKAVISRIATVGSREAQRYPSGMALRLITDDAARSRLGQLLDDVRSLLARTMRPALPPLPPPLR